MIRLDGEWRLAVDPENQGRERNWHAEPPATARPAPVPGIVQQVFPTFVGVAWYWHVFAPPRLPAGHERALLRFAAVEYRADVWLNGQLLGSHENAETPFELDATAALRAAGNLLAVRVLKPGAKERTDGYLLGEIPHRNQYDPDTYQPGMGYNVSGLVGPVELRLAPAVRVADVFAQPDAATRQIRVAVTIRNATDAVQPLKLRVLVAAAREGYPLNEVAVGTPVPAGDSTHELVVPLAQVHRWGLDDPYLYQVTAAVAAGAGDRYQHQHSVRCGFRDFRVVDGFFYLNERRVFLRSSHTGNHMPIGQLVPPEPGLMWRDLMMAKASGFNCLRFIAGMPYPEQLDCCDEIGLMVYEENLAGWVLGDSPQMGARFDYAVTEMVRRDRNHPSVTLWGLLNETQDGPVFRRAVAALKLVRELDPTRLVLLGSGRWDGQPAIGSVSNPGGTEWEGVWGVEATGTQVSAQLSWAPGGYLDRAGDAHFYPMLPMEDRYRQQLRTLGAGTKPVFLSECGTGSQFNAIDEGRAFDPFQASPDLPDLALIRSMAERFTADLQRFGLQGVYPFPADFFRDSYRVHSHQRRVMFDHIRANPQLCGYNATGLLDHAVTGEGLWTFWRRSKTGMPEVLEDGWSPLRWCLFVEPTQPYARRPFVVEAVLATEDILRPGDYPVTCRIWGAKGVVWEKRVTLSVPATAGTPPRSPLAVPALKARVTRQLPPGHYVFAADLERGGAPSGDRLPFRLTTPADAPAGHGPLYVWGVSKPAQKLLTAHGYTCRPCVPTGARPQGLVVVGEVPAEPRATAAWATLRTWITRGANVLLLSPQPFRVKPEQLPWGAELAARPFHDWLYHREIVAKTHPVFAGLSTGGILDWAVYGQVVGHDIFDCDPVPTEVIAASFAVGYCCRGGYNSGVVMGRRQLGQGQLVFNGLSVLEHVGRQPVADRLLLNLVRYAQRGQ